MVVSLVKILFLTNFREQRLVVEQYEKHQRVLISEHYVSEVETANIYDTWQNLFSGCLQNWL